MIKKIFFTISLIIVSLIVTNGYLNSGFPGTDDGIWAPVRLSSMRQELRQGQFPVRWSGHLNFGYGYPLFHFSYPGVYYLGSLFSFAHLGLANSIKLLFVLGVTSTILGMYYLVIYITKSTTSAICSAILYAATPYLITNLYRRGSIGEIMAAGVLPWLLLVLYKSVHKPSKSIFVISSVLTAVLVLMHNVSTLLSLPLLVGFVIYQSARYTNIAKSLAYKIFLILTHVTIPVTSLVMGMALSMFFWLPAIHDIAYTKIAQKPLTNIADWFAPFTTTFFYPLFSQTEIFDANSYRLSVGFLSIFMLLILTIFSIRSRLKSLFYFTLLLWGYIFMTTLPSTTLWHILPGFNSVDFPWRIITPLSVFLPLVFALHFRTKLFSSIFVICTIVAFLIALPNYKHRDLLDWPDSLYATNANPATANNEYYNLYLSPPITNIPEHKFKVLSGQILKFETIKESSTYRSYRIESAPQTSFEYQLMYFPNWQVLIDDRIANYDYKQNGLIQIHMPSGPHSIQIQFIRTPLIIFSETISVLAFLTCIFLLIKVRIKI